MLNINRFDFESDKILSSLLKKERNLFLSLTEPLFFKKGHLIFYDAGLPTGVFLLQSGRAKIYKTGSDGKEQIFYIYKQGDLFGYHALLCNEKYEDSCEALEDCKTLFISRANFEHLLAQLPRLKTLLIQNMGHEFGVLVNTIKVLAQKPLRERLALYLLVLDKRYYNEERQKSVIDLPREDLANIIGTARESLGRLLKEFKEEKLIEIHNKKITIVDINRLEKLAKVG